MLRCIALAQQGLGHVAPNPMVGSVVVHEGEIIGEGFHEQYGGAHAEVNAIASVKDKSLLSASTLYVNLEPCSHHGKTPPCSDLIIQKGIKKVVIGNMDPNPLVAGKGIAKLKEEGVDVMVGVLEKECRFVNRRFLTFQEKHRPYIILKWAESAEGFMAPNEAKQVWLSSKKAKVLSHQWRSEESAILVGRKTVEIDNPQLTTRLVKGKNPLRVVIDKMNTVPHSANVLDDAAETIVFNAEHTQQKGTTHWVKIDFDGNELAQIMETLYHKNILSLIVEGGAETLQSFIVANLWDEARIIKTKVSLLEGKPAPRLTISPAEKTIVGEDEVFTYYNF